MPKTSTQMIEQVRSNLGNRADNLIGTQNVDDVILNAINDGIMEVARDSHLRDLSRVCTFTISASTQSYAFPTTDVDGNTIRVRTIRQAVLTVDSLDTELEKVEFSRNIRRYLNVDTHRPQYYSTYGRKVYLFPTPSEAGTVTLYVNIVPTAIGHNATHPYGEEFDDILEAYATGSLFLTLQETEDGLLWMQMFERKFKQLRQMEKIDVDLQQRDGPSLRGYSSANPATDPLVRRYP